MLPGETEQLEARLTALEAQNDGLARALVEARVAGTFRTSRRDYDAYAAVIASLIGLVALLLSGYTAYVQRQQLRAQVWPHLELANSTGNLKLYLGNDGTGPARVTAFRVTVQNKAVKTWGDVVRGLGHDPDKAGITWTSVNGRVFPSGREMLEIAAPVNEASRPMFRDLLMGDRPFTMTVCYCSVLNECWVSRYGGRLPNEKDLPDDTCPITPDQQFNY
jgi:hypothetical protein